MRRLIRQWFPSMYVRRLMLLSAGAVVAVVLLSLQMSRLTLAQGEQMRQRAESVLVERRLIPTVRGRILDRRGAVLAEDRPSYDVAVDYDAISGEWSYKRARRQAYRENREQWPQLSYSQRSALTSQYQQEYDASLERLWEALCAIGNMERPELERRKSNVLERVQQIASDVWIRRQVRRTQELGEPVELAEVVVPIREQVESHPLLLGVDDEAMLRVQTLADAADDPRWAAWENVKVVASRRRAYPRSTQVVTLERKHLPSPLREDEPMELEVAGVTTHAVGWMRDAWREDVDRRPFRNPDSDQPNLGGYLPGDQVGAWGIEASMEQALRGQRGQVLSYLESSREQRQEPEPGQDVILTLDSALQARVQGVLDPRFGLTTIQPWHGDRKYEKQPKVGEIVSAAAIVLDVQTGHVLAAVSSPSFERDQLSGPGNVWEDRLRQPYINRVIGRPYQPGSTVKPLVLAAAISNENLAPDSHIECLGALDPDHPTAYRCWIYKQYGSTHGPLGGAEAIARSCNIFFYTLGRRLGGRDLVNWYERFGLGRAYACGLGEQVSGDLPAPEKPNLSDAIFMAIGQGPVRWTLLQAAGSYAALARGGAWIEPTFIAAPRQPAEPRPGAQLTDQSVQQALDGLFEAANAPHGTAHHLSTLNREPIFNIDHVRIYGKSGTAEAVPFRVDSNGDDRITRDDQVVLEGDHGWFMGLAQRNGSPRPDYVIAVVVEFGGSGGLLAGPIANQILHALRAEGYL